MRNIIAYRRSTPIYVYNVDGAELSGIDLNSMSIGMAIRTETKLVYILPVMNAGSSMFDLKQSESYTIFSNNEYCSHEANTNKYRLSIPLWLFPSTFEDEGYYQIFLFNNSAYTIREDGSASTMMATNIILDAGAFNLIESLVPPIVGQARMPGEGPIPVEGQIPGEGGEDRGDTKPILF